MVFVAGCTPDWYFQIDADTVPSLKVFMAKKINKRKKREMLLLDDMNSNLCYDISYVALCTKVHEIETQ